MVTKGADGSVSGGDGLKQSQAYPPLYGPAVRQAWLQAGNFEAEDDLESYGSVSDTDYTDLRDSDDHGDLRSAAEFFGLAADRFQC